MNDDPIGIQFIEESKKHIILARDRINHCLAQLQDQDIWWSPAEGCNCIGIILQHLCGNLRQWIIAGVGGEQDIRERPKEFLIEEQLSKEAIQLKFNTLVGDVLAILIQLPPERLSDKKRIQGFDNSLLGALYVAVTHLELHAGQIVYITRLKLGLRYKVLWEPADEEQGTV